jgi:hypothetical protein
MGCSNWLCDIHQPYHRQEIENDASPRLQIFQLPMCLKVRRNGGPKPSREQGEKLCEESEDVGYRML